MRAGAPFAKPSPRLFGARPFGRFAFRLSLPGTVAAALIGAMFLTPYTTFRPVWDVQFTVSDLFFCWAASTLLLSRGLDLRPLGDLTFPWYAGLAALLVGLFVSSIVRGDPARCFIVVSQYGFAFAMLPMLIINRDREELTRMAAALVAGVVLAECIGAVAYFVLNLSFNQAERISPSFITGGHRLGAFMADANWNAAMISLTMPFALYLKRTGRIGPLVSLAGITLLLLGLLLSGSFTGVICTSVAILVFLLVAQDMGSLRIGLALAAVALAALAAGFELPEAFQHRIASAIEAGDISQAGTFVGRMELAREAWGMVGDHMLLGVGADQYRVISRYGAPVHNIYLLLWVEGGLVSLLGWVTMLMVPTVCAGRCPKADRNAAALTLSVVAAFVVFSTASPHMYARSWAVPLLLAIAVTASSCSPRRHPGLAFGAR